MSDLIRRQDAIDAVQKLPNAGIQWFVNAESVFKVLEELPSAERKRGEWEFYSRDEDAFDVYGNESWAIRYYCSNCNFMHAFIENRTGQYNYCPQCGAYMRGEDDE